jgi:uncharacterized protein (DUF885 family)
MMKAAALKESLAAFLLVAAMGLAGCSNAQPAAAAEDNPEFESYLRDYVITNCESNYVTMHQYFEDPQAFGIDPEKAEVSLGTIQPTDEDIAMNQTLYEDLTSFSKDSLSESQQDIYDQLLWQFELYFAENDEKYDGLDQLWTTYTNPASDLVTYFSEYEIRCEEDIQPLVELIEDVPRYFQNCLDYTAKQEALGTLMYDYDSIAQTCQDVLDAGENSAVNEGLYQEIDDLNLDNGEQYKEQIKEALNASFYPSYQTLIDELKQYESIPFQGLDSFENGASYYEWILKEASGSSKSVKEIAEDLEDRLDVMQGQLLILSAVNSDWLDEADNADTGFESVDAVMDFLADNYTKAFPHVSTMNYVLDPLTNEQSQEGVVAYFMIPPVDNTAAYRIRYNARDYGDDPSSLTLFETLAHEGIPGHMYQSQYNAENFSNVVQYFYESSGFTEGWATYAAFEAMDWLDVDADVIEAYKLMEQYGYDYTAYVDIFVNGSGKTKAEYLEQFEPILGDEAEGLYDTVAASPGLFISYYYGCDQMLELKESAQNALGDKFDASAFNNAVLQAGAVNFDIVTDNVNAWIQTQKQK